MTVDDVISLTLLFGGFVISALLSILPLCPWFRGIHTRWILSLSGLIPVALLIILGAAELLVTGRDLSVLTALSPILLAISFPLIALRKLAKDRSLSRKKRLTLILYTVGLTASTLWAAWILWLMTDSGFMGANC